MKKDKQYETVDPVFEAKIVVTVMGQATSAADFKVELDATSLSDVARAIHEGDFIGDWQTASVEKLPVSQVAHRLDDIRNDGGFFNMDDQNYPKDADRDEASGRILRAQMDQGMDVSGLEERSRAFIEKMGLSDAYATFLENPEFGSFFEPNESPEP